MTKITTSTLKKKCQEYLTEGETLIKQGKLDHAIAILYRGLSLAEILNESGVLHRFQLMIAQALHDQGQAEQVVEWCNLTPVEEMEPDIACRILSMKVVNLMYQGYFQQADTQIERMMNHPEVLMQWMALMNRGLLNIYLFRYLNQYTLDRAEMYLEQAEELCQDDLVDSTMKLKMQAKISYYQALCYMEEGLNHYASEKLSAALRTLEQLQKSDTRIIQIRILNEMGRVSIRQMDYDAAIRYLDSARNLALQTSFQVGLNYNIYYRGLLYMEMLSTEMACTHLLTASFEFLRRKQYPEVAAIHLYLSQLYQSQNSEKSEKYLELHQHYLSFCEYLPENTLVEDAYQWMNS